MTPVERDRVNRAAYTGDICAKCGKQLAPEESVFRWGYGFELNIDHAPVCAECNGEPRSFDHWHELPCDGCGRPVFNSHFRAWRWTVCSQRCRTIIETRQRTEKRRAARALRPCQNCGVGFLPRRADARTCGAACRQAIHRTRVRASREITGGNLPQGSIRYADRPEIDDTLGERWSGASGSARCPVIGAAGAAHEPGP
jgi:hypothetical protein